MDKNYSISFIRFTAMLFVIFCHIMEQSGYTAVGNYLAVGVQLFLLISGYLYSNKEFDTPYIRVNFIIKNSVKILADYYLCVILFFIPVYYVIEPDVINVPNIVNILTCAGTWWGVHHLWYIPYCLLCYMITPVLYDIRKYLFGKKHTVIWLIVLFALIEILMTAYHSYFLPSRIICYCIGYFLPLLIKGKNKYLAWGGGSGNSSIPQYY